MDKSRNDPKWHKLTKATIDLLVLNFDLRPKASGGVQKENKTTYCFRIHASNLDVQMFSLEVSSSSILGLCWSLFVCSVPRFSVTICADEAPAIDSPLIILSPLILNTLAAPRADPILNLLNHVSPRVVLGETCLLIVKGSNVDLLDTPILLIFLR